MTKQTIKPIKAMRPLWRSKERYKIAKGGRGSGKSYGIAERFVIYAMRRPCKLLCTRDIQNTLSDSALAILKRVIRDQGFSGVFRPTKHGLACLNGSEFIFRGLQNPDRIKSLEGINYCWVEEAHRVTKDAWQDLIPTIREPNSEIWISYNPDSEHDPVTAIEKKDSVEVVTVNYPDNPYFPEVLRREMEWDKAHDYDKYLHIWEGHYREVSDAQVFKGKYRVAAFETPEDAEFYYGADWGFSQDPTVLVRCFIRNQVLWIDAEAYGVGVDIDDIPVLFEGVPQSKKWPIVGDSQRPDTISYLNKHGYKIKGAKKGKGSVEDGVEFIKSFRGVVIHERCKHVADEFKLYSYKTDKLTGDPLPILEDKNNHFIDSIRYALEKVKRMYGSVANFSAVDLGL